MFFHLINWFRETVTTFSVEKDPEMRAKVIIRLQTITELQHLLEEWINGMYMYSINCLVALVLSTLLLIIVTYILL